VEKRRILIVDDNHANAALMSFILQKTGYDLRTAGDAEEAMVMVREFQPVLIMMDLQLPGMDGLELTRRLKADIATYAIIIIAVTAYAMKGDEERAIDAGCDGYLSKPIETRKLPGIVADYFARAGFETIKED
jgi:CheY-like chemotaxis protein